MPAITTNTNVGRLVLKGSDTLTVAPGVVVEYDDIQVTEGAGIVSGPATFRRLDLPLRNADQSDGGITVKDNGRWDVSGSAWSHRGIATGLGGSQIVVKDVPLSVVGREIVIPDTRETCPDPSQTEVRIVTGVNGLTLTLDKPLLYTHKAGCMVYYANSDLIFESANPNGVRGHLLFTGGASVKMQNFLCRDMGRTRLWADPLIDRRDKTINLDRDGVLPAVNPPGRYPVHCHHLMGVCTCEEEVCICKTYLIRNGFVMRSRKGGVVVHGTNNGLLDGCTVFDADGMGFYLGEDGTEINNTFRDNRAIYIPGVVTDYDKGRFLDNNQQGYHGTSIGVGLTTKTLRNHWVDNVADSVGRTGVGFICYATGVPAIQRAVQKVNGVQYTMSGNRVQGANRTGVKLYGIGSAGSDNNVLPGDVEWTNINFDIADVNTAGLAITHTKRANVKIKVSGVSGGTGVMAWDSVLEDVNFDLDIDGKSIGLAVPAYARNVIIRGIIKNCTRGLSIDVQRNSNNPIGFPSMVTFQDFTVVKGANWKANLIAVTLALQQGPIDWMMSSRYLFNNLNGNGKKLEWFMVEQLPSAVQPDTTFGSTGKVSIGGLSPEGRAYFGAGVAVTNAMAAAAGFPVIRGRMVPAGAFALPGYAGLFAEV